MKLYLSNHDYRYALEQSLIAFFPETRPVASQEPPTPFEDGVVSVLRRGAAFLTADTVIARGGVVQKARARRRIDPSLPAREQKRQEMWLVKRSFCKAAFYHTGRVPAWGELTGIRPAQVALRYLRKGVTGRATKGILRREHGVSPERADLCVQSAQAALTVQQTLSPRDICLYVGIPFCPTRCAYCSFVSHAVQRSGKMLIPYVETLTAEIEAAGLLLKALSLRPVAVYVGGGTPTTLDLTQLDTLLSALARHMDLSGVREYTVEAGRPDTVDSEKFALLRIHGVDRVSVNPQTMEDDVLKKIGRPHTAEDTLRAYEDAVRAGFTNINMDLIAGLPGDTPGGFARTLFRLLPLLPEQITLHTLARKRGAALSGQAPPDARQERAVEQMLNGAHDCLRENGYDCYYLYRQKYMQAGLENSGWRRTPSTGLYNICMMEELATVIALGAGGVTKLVSQNRERIERLFHPKFPEEYVRAGGGQWALSELWRKHKKGIASFYEEGYTI